MFKSMVYDLLLTLSMQQWSGGFRWSSIDAFNLVQNSDSWPGWCWHFQAAWYTISNSYFPCWFPCCDSLSSFQRDMNITFFEPTLKSNSWTNVTAQSSMFSINRSKRLGGYLGDYRGNGEAYRAGWRMCGWGCDCFGVSDERNVKENVRDDPCAHCPLMTQQLPASFSLSWKT